MRYIFLVTFLSLLFLLEKEKAFSSTDRPAVLFAWTELDQTVTNSPDSLDDPAEDQFDYFIETPPTFSFFTHALYSINIQPDFFSTSYPEQHPRAPPYQYS